MNQSCVGAMYIDDSCNTKQSDKDRGGRGLNPDFWKIETKDSNCSNQHRSAGRIETKDRRGRDSGFLWTLCCIPNIVSENCSN